MPKAKAKAAKAERPPIDDALQSALDLARAEEQTDFDRLVVQYIQQAIAARSHAQAARDERNA